MITDHWTCRNLDHQEKLLIIPVAAPGKNMYWKWSQHGLDLALEQYDEHQKMTSHDSRHVSHNYISVWCPSGSMTRQRKLVALLAQSYFQIMQYRQKSWFSMCPSTMPSACLANLLWEIAAFTINLITALLIRHTKSGNLQQTEY